MSAAESTRYADLEIRILARRDRGYPVEITFSGEREFPHGHLDPEIVPWVARSPLAREEGERLFGLLLGQPELQRAWAEARGESAARRVRLRIDPDAPELHQVPWELVCEAADGEPALPLAAHSETPFSRYLAGPWRHGRPVVERPLRLLVAIANPENLADCGLGPIDVAAERRALEEALSGGGSGEIEVTVLPDETHPEPLTLASLEDELRRGYHALHLIAHGRFSDTDGTAYLCLADLDHRAEPVRDRAIAAVLARQKEAPRLVFLASCESATRSSADAFRGLAPRLVAAGIPVVLAMQDRVPATTARTFARTFYRRLLAHGLVDLAANEARSALWTAELPGAGVPGSAIPVLFLRQRDGRLLSVQKEDLLQARPTPAATTERDGHSPPRNPTPPSRQDRSLPTPGRKSRRRSPRIAALVILLTSALLAGLYERSRPAIGSAASRGTGPPLPCLYGGAYLGTYVGGDDGAFLLVVDALTGSLAVLAESIEPESDEYLWLTGDAFVNEDEGTVSVRAGDLENLAVEGRITSPDTITGTWKNPGEALFGVFTGHRVGGVADATHRFTGLYRGTDDTGIFALDIDRSDTVTVAIQSTRKSKSGTFSGRVAGTALSVAERGLEVIGVLDRSAGTLTGYWSDESDGSSGTLSGSGCQIADADG